MQPYTNQRERVAILPLKKRKRKKQASKLSIHWGSYLTRISTSSRHRGPRPWRRVWHRRRTTARQGGIRLSKTEEKQKQNKKARKWATTWDKDLTKTMRCILSSCWLSAEKTCRPRILSPTRFHFLFPGNEKRKLQIGMGPSRVMFSECPGTKSTMGNLSL